MLPHLSLLLKRTLGAANSLLRELTTLSDALEREGRPCPEETARRARQWAIYYDTGQVFTDADGSFEAAPADGVICVVRRQDGDNVEFISGADFYFRFAEDGTIAGTEDIGPILRLLGVKMGRYTSHTNHARVMARARADWHGGAL